MPFPLIAAAITGAASLGSAYMGSKAVEGAQANAQRAAQIQKKAAKKSGEVVEKRGERGLQYLRPYGESGMGAQNLLSSALGINGPQAQQDYFTGFENDPGYQATLQAGLDAIGQGQAFTGSYRSGNTLKELMAHGQRMQYEQYKDRLNRLAGVGQQGLTAASTGANIQQNIGLGKANALMGGANAQAGGIYNQSMLGMYGQGQMNQGYSDLAGTLSGPLSTYLGSSLGFGTQAPGLNAGMAYNPAGYYTNTAPASYLPGYSL